MKSGKARDEHFQLRNQDKQWLYMHVHVVLNKEEGSLVWPDGWMDGREGRKEGGWVGKEGERKKMQSVNKW